MNWRFNLGIILFNRLPGGQPLLPPAEPAKGQHKHKSEETQQRTKKGSNARQHAKPHFDETRSE